MNKLTQLELEKKFSKKASKANLVEKLETFYGTCLADNLNSEHELLNELNFALAMHMVQRSNSSGEHEYYDTKAKAKKKYHYFGIEALLTSMLKKPFFAGYKKDQVVQLVLNQLAKYDGELYYNIKVKVNKSSSELFTLVNEAERELADAVNMAEVNSLERKLSSLQGQLNFSMKKESEVESQLEANDGLLELNEITYDEHQKFIEVVTNWHTSISLAVTYTLEPDFETLPEADFFVPPMVEKPKAWTTTEKGGFYTLDNNITLNRGEQNQPQAVLDVINLLQVNNFEVTNEPSESDLFDYKLKKAHEKNAKIGSSIKTLGAIKLVTHDLGYKSEADITKAVTAETLTFDQTLEYTKNGFYFPWSFDSRGRMYSKNYNVALQSDKYRKGTITPTLLSFPEASRSNEWQKHALYYTKIDLANTAGHDKLFWAEKVEWVDTNRNELASMSDNLLDSPLEFKKALKALELIEQNIYPAHMVYLDASNQALQLYATMLADKQTATTCNLANGAELADAYQLLADELNLSYGVEFFTRAHCKKALMTALYGSTKHAEQVLEALSASEKAFFEELKGANELDYRIGEALVTIAPKAMLAMETCLDLNKAYICDTYHWTLPDGFKVKYDVKLKTSVFGLFEINTANKNSNKRTTHKLAYSFQYKTYGASKTSRGLAPNIVHSVDGYIAREMVRRMNGKFITTIHDAFACHPEHCELMKQNYSDILCELLELDLFNDILSQISVNAGKTPDFQVAKTNDLTKADIQGSLYKLA